jgi:hypothetical protein
MTFEEFFSKKRIDLAALQLAAPALFSEFKTHYEEMGEKSFDHTKKYWFNKLRRQYVLAPEIKTEKVRMDNPLAEQTVTEELIELSSPPRSLGFKPKFRAAVPPKPVDTEQEQAPEPSDTKPDIPATPATPTPPKPGFTPRFKAANMPKPVVDPAEEIKPVTPEAPVNTTLKPGFTPRFKAANMSKPAVDSTEEIKPESPAPSDGPATPIMEKAEEPTPPVTENTAPPTSEESAPKPAYKPRFNMKNIPPKKEE